MSWPATIIHTFWNNEKPNKGSWFIIPVYKPDGRLFTQDIQYYIYDTGNMVSTSLIILSLIVAKHKTTSYNFVLSVVFTISVLDIFNYWLCYKQSVIILVAETILMILAAFIIVFLKWKKNLKSGMRS